MTSLGTAMRAFDISVRADGLAESTKKWYRSMLKRFAGHFGTKIDISAISRQAIREYIVSLRETEQKYIGAANKPPQSGKLSSESVAGHIRVLHRFWSFAEIEYGLPNPMVGIKRPKHKSFVKAVSAADFVKLFHAAGAEHRRNPERDQAMLALLADSAVRLSAMLGLRLLDLDLNLCRAYVREKGGKLSAIMFTPVTAGLIVRWLAVRESTSEYVFTNGRGGGGQLTAGGYHSMLKLLKQEARIKGKVNPHSFRHAFAREYLRAGGDLATLSRLMNHSNVKITADQYAVFTSGELAQFHEKFSPLPALLEDKKSNSRSDF